ncbi:ATP-binding protein [Streptomyces sp. NEAU-W12]|uniref:ATP-binding protein n=1 Tax=Streptomyces sp. NEAU-W12 TaxID=2994668 RepID=UPI003A4C65DB
MGRARALFREQATPWELPQDVTDTAELLLSELMTNAHRHAKVPAGRETRSRCELTDTPLRITVADADDTLPTPTAACPDYESGRGLTWVVTPAEDWGTRRRECGTDKEVRFDVALPRGSIEPTRLAPAVGRPPVTPGAVP